MTAKTVERLGSRSDLRRFSDIRELLPDVSNPSPLVRLNHVEPGLSAETYLKLEWLNPFGSVKDRAAAYLLSGLNERGALGDGELVEASSGNTSIALAALATLSGTKLITTVPSAVPEETIIILRMLGAEVWETPDELCPMDHPRDGAIALAKSLAASSDRFRATEQYENEDNVRAHYETTGPEIWRQTEGRVTWFVAAYGTTGTITGAARFLKQQNPEIRVVGVEPEPGHRLPGMKSFGESKQPDIFDPTVIDRTVVVGDDDAYEVTKELWRREALMVGPSTGAVVAAAGQIDTSPDDVIVAISADSGTRYTSYFKEILGEHEGRPVI